METYKQTFGQVRAFAPDVEKTRTIEFVISSNTKDRHRTVLPVDKWELDRFNANGIVGYQHNVYGGDLCNAPDPDDVIGSGRAWVEGDLLIGSVTFEPAEINPKAEKIFRKVLAGTLKATSVGFNPTAEGAWGAGEESERGSNPTYYYAGQELLEFSIVNIPSNPDALRRSMRDQATNAISYIYRQLNGNYRFSDIEEMTVRQVIDLLEMTPKQRAISVKVEVEIDQPEEKPVDQPEIPEPEPQPSTSDEDLVVATRAKLALMAQQ
jgi:hypothetical protein